jgi:hypothetical protein
MLFEACWKQQFECGAMAGRAVHLDRAAMALNNAPHCRQAQPPSCKLGRVERIEYSANDIRVHAHAGVVYFQRHISPWLDLTPWHCSLDIGIVDLLHTGRDQNGAGLTLRYRLCSVDHQIHHDLLDLSGIPLDTRKTFRQFQPHLHRPRNGGLNEAADLPNLARQVERFYDKTALPRIR